MSIIRRVVVIQKEGRLNLKGLPFQVGDSVEAIVFPRVKEITDQKPSLRGTVLNYTDPFDPVSANDWETLK